MFRPPFCFGGDAFDFVDLIKSTKIIYPLGSFTPPLPTFTNTFVVSPICQARPPNPQEGKNNWAVADVKLNDDCARAKKCHRFPGPRPRSGYEGFP
jgi:hypothetical protein